MSFGDISESDVGNANNESNLQPPMRTKRDTDVNRIGIVESYQSKLSRRESLKWMGVTLAATAIPMAFPTDLYAATSSTISSTVGDDNVASWPKLDIPEIKSKGYGQDPDLIAATVPWPLTLSSQQLNLVAQLCDILIPAEGNVPSASAVGVPDVIDEWISAPYPLQQQHRSLLLPGLVWIDNEAIRRYDNRFTQLTASQQFEIIDTIAFPNSNNPALALPVAFFGGLRYLATGFFFTTAEGSDDLGYIGNKPIKGDYPGPTSEALIHLEGVMDELGLSF